MIAPSTPTSTRPISARRSSSSVMPPLATTGRSVAAQTSRSSCRLGPCSMPSLSTSVTTYRAQPSSSSRASTSYRSPPSRVQPRAARVRPRTSRPTATRSPQSAMARAHHSGVSRAAVPMLTRRQPVAIAAASDSSSRMPPLISTSMSSRPTISACSSRLCPRPKAASRSTRWIHSAPASCHRSAAATGSPNRFSDPATPCTSWTACPPAMSTAGSSWRYDVSCGTRPILGTARVASPERPSCGLGTPFGAGGATRRCPRRNSAVPEAQLGVRNGGRTGGGSGRRGR